MRVYVYIQAGVLYTRWINSCQTDEGPGSVIPDLLASYSERHPISKPLAWLHACKLC